MSTSPREGETSPLFVASASPRRAALLKSVGLEFIRHPVDVDETPPPGASPEETVKELARRKAEALRGRFAAGVVLAADTLVALDGEFLGKPETTARAIDTLERLSGRTHEVWTGVAVLRLPDGPVRAEAERTIVEFHALDDDVIRAYAATGEPLDKAGAYAIQGEGGVLVKRVRGSVSNVVGLPLGLVLRMLDEAGHDLPAPVKESLKTGRGP